MANIYWIIEKAKQESSRKTSISDLLTMPKPLTMWITRNWEILQEMGIPDHLTCLLRNLYAGQEATVRTGRGTTNWFQIGKGVHQGCILSSFWFNLSAEYIMRNAGLEEAQLESRLPEEVSITSDMQMTPPKAVYCHPAYLTSMQSTSWEILGWKKHKLESRLLGEISITSDMQMTPPLWQKA